MRENQYNDLLSALHAAVNKWTAILSGGGDNGYRFCTLCDLYREDDCRDCPIGENCRNSPYMSWIYHHRECHEAPGRKPLQILCDECQAIAVQELVFLENLVKKHSPLPDKEEQC